MHILELLHIAHPYKLDPHLLHLLFDKKNPYKQVVQYPLFRQVMQPNIEQLLQTYELGST